MVRKAGLDVLDLAEDFGPLKDQIALLIFSSGLERYVHEHNPSDFPRASTVGHFRVGRLNRVPISPDGRLGRTLGLRKRQFLNGAHDETSYATIGEIPGFCDDDEPEEVTIFVHGWLATEVSALGRMSLLQHAMERVGYDHPVVGYTWDTDQSVLEWRTAKILGAWNGPKLARFTLDFRRRNPDTKIRWISNSLGAHPVFSALSYLHDREHHDLLESVTVLGGTVPSNSVAADGRYGDAVRDVTGELHNYWTTTDDTLRYYYRLAEGENSVGGTGANGRTPDNYTDHRVDHVTDHFSFYIPERGCMDEVVADFEPEFDPGQGDVTREYGAFDPFE